MHAITVCCRSQLWIDIHCTPLLVKICNSHVFYSGNSKESEFLPYSHKELILSSHLSLWTLQIHWVLQEYAKDGLEWAFELTTQVERSLLLFQAVCVCHVLPGRKWMVD